MSIDNERFYRTKMTFLQCQRILIMYLFIDLSCYDWTIFFLIAVLHFFLDCTGRLYDEVKDLQADTKDIKAVVKQILHATIRESEKNKDAKNGQISKVQFIIGEFYSFCMVANCCCQLRVLI